MGTRALAYRHRNQEPEPFASMNITPLIDVMLVILVMMILSVPLMTNKVPLDLASGKPDPQKIVTHIVDLDAAGTVALDGTPLDLATLKGRLARMRADPNAELQIRADAHARYERFDQALAAIKGAGITRLGFIGNEQFADFSTR